jgi:hypothetical protein
MMVHMEHTVIVCVHGVRARVPPVNIARTLQQPHRQPISTLLSQIVPGLAAQRCFKMLFIVIKAFVLCQVAADVNFAPIKKPPQKHRTAIVMKNAKEMLGEFIWVKVRNVRSFVTGTIAKHVAHVWLTLALVKRRTSVNMMTTSQIATTQSVVGWLS